MSKTHWREYRRWKHQQLKLEIDGLNLEIEFGGYETLLMKNCSSGDTHPKMTIYNTAKTKRCIHDFVLVTTHFLPVPLSKNMVSLCPIIPLLFIIWNPTHQHKIQVVAASLNPYTPLLTFIRESSSLVYKIWRDMHLHDNLTVTRNAIYIHIVEII